jgi:nucleotide-binding universal stress UspA family protein
MATNIASTPTLVEPIHLDTSNLKFKTILVATDFSPPSYQALEAAVRIATIYNSEIILAHASFPTAFTGGEGVIPPEFLVDQLADDRKQMQEFVASQPELAKLRLDTVVTYASPLTLIEQLVEKNGVDLIVAGSHGSSGIERVALGSIAESIIYDSTVPVLIMGPVAHPDKEPFRSILFATDLSSTGLRPAQYASSLAEHFHSQLLVLHVIEQPSEDAHIQSDIEKQLLQDMHALLPGDASQLCVAQFRVEHGTPAERIVEAARSVKASLVVVGAKHTNALVDHLPWLTLSKIIREAACGVLVVKNRLV